MTVSHTLALSRTCQTAAAYVPRPSMPSASKAQPGRMSSHRWSPRPAASTPWSMQLAPRVALDGHEEGISFVTGGVHRVAPHPSCSLTFRQPLRFLFPLNGNHSESPGMNETDEVEKYSTVQASQEDQMREWVERMWSLSDLAMRQHGLALSRSGALTRALDVWSRALMVQSCRAIPRMRDWARFFTGAPPRRRQSVERYSIVKRG